MEDGFRINGTTEEANKLVFFRTFVGSDYFTPLESSATFADVLRTLDIGQAVCEAQEDFLKANEIDGVTLNKDECMFCCKTVPMLGGIVGAESKWPIRAEPRL